MSVRPEDDATARLIADLVAALAPFAEIELPARDGFTMYTRAEILAARAAVAEAKTVLAKQGS